MHVVRTPNPTDATRSQWVIIPKQRIGLSQTYVDARGWTLSDVAANGGLVSRLLDAGKADQLQFLANPKIKQDIQLQITDALAGKLVSQTTQPATNKSPMAPASSNRLFVNNPKGFPSSHLIRPAFSALICPAYLSSLQAANFQKFVGIPRFSIA